MRTKEKFNKDGFLVHKLFNSEPLQNARDVLDNYFPENSTYTDTNEYRERLLACQNEINALNVHQRIIANERAFFNELFDSQPLSVQSVVYLRGVRPASKEMMEYLDFHRENFYCDEEYINHQINVVVPLRNFSRQTSMEYVPGSHLIPDENIETLKYNSLQSGVERYSTGHRLGLTYNPKRIVDGVDFSKAQRIELNSNEVFVFSTRLIHGGGSNLTSDIRFSLDFGVINNKAIEGGMKKEHFAAYDNLKSHYVSLP